MLGLKKIMFLIFNKHVFREETVSILNDVCRVVLSLFLPMFLFFLQFIFDLIFKYMINIIVTYSIFGSNLKY